jgi:arylsulfatase A-like enzyme
MSSARRAALAAALGLAAATAAAAPKPSVVMISVCSLRADHLGCYGYRRDASPHIDELARDSVVFEQAVSASNWTLPSVMSAFTSLYPAEHGLTNYRVAAATNVVTMAELFRSNGYRTGALMGSEHMLWPARGFLKGFETSGYFHPRALGDALAWLELPPPPLFLYVHDFASHVNFNAPELYTPAEEFRNAFGPVPALDVRLEEVKRVGGRWQDASRQPTPAEKRALDALYDSAVRTSDAEIGKLLDLLKRLGLYDDSIIVLLADHGDGLFEHGLEQHVTSHFEEVVRSAFIIKLPHQAHAGLRVKGPVRTIDLLPTLIEVAGVAPSALLERQMRGESLVPAFDGASVARDACIDTSFSPIFLRTFRRKDGWKLTLDLAGGSRSLYDLAADPKETRNVYGSEPAVEAELERALEDCPRLSPRPSVKAE